MAFDFFLNATQAPERDYINWAPARCVIRSQDATARRIRLSNVNPNQGGQVVFLPALGSPPVDALEIDLPANSGFGQFFVAGKFDQNTGRGFPSIADKDAGILAEELADTSVRAEQELMVRVRKDANTLTPEERDRFLSALVTLNQRGDFVDFQNMHIADTSMEVHGRSCFLPWHRLYLLDLERKLQQIDPSVALPYWQFDNGAPNLFARDFIGEPDASGLVQFSNSNPLVNWRLSVFGEGSGRIRRVPVAGFDPSTSGARVTNNESRTFNQGTTGAGRNSQTNFRNFERIEGDPHGSAHVSFNGQISDIGRAPADPLFFMLHCNIDRLWAKWQWISGLNNPNDESAYYKRGTGPINPDSTRVGRDRIGNYLDDTLWPWNGHRGAPRPRTAPGTYFPASPYLSVPGRYPDIRSTIDFQGQLELGRNLGFCYDDVPYEFE